MKLQDLVSGFCFPKYCLLCHRFGRYLCTDCLNSCFKEHREDHCHVCQGLLRHKRDGSRPFFVHTPCRKRTSLDGLFAVWEYNEAVKIVISSIKYRFQFKIIPALRLTMQYKYSTLPVAVNLIVPVPLFEQRRAWRGFNQAELLAGCLGWNLQMVLERKINTKPQARMNRSQRLKNMAGAFTLKPGAAISGKSILLVDDIATTGSTLEAAARCLKDHGARTVYGFVLALEK